MVKTEQASGKQEELEGLLDLRLRSLAHGGFVALCTSLGPPCPGCVQGSGHPVWTPYLPQISHIVFSHPGQLAASSPSSPSITRALGRPELHPAHIATQRSPLVGLSGAYCLCRLPASYSLLR